MALVVRNGFNNSYCIFLTWDTEENKYYSTSTLAIRDKLCLCYLVIKGLNEENFLTAMEHEVQLTW